MATGPDHYTAAEQILGNVRQLSADDPTVDSQLREAQVHATLALTAAAVNSYTEDRRDWRKVIRAK